MREMIGFKVEISCKKSENDCRNEAAKGNQWSETAGRGIHRRGLSKV
jgi:hypothetical protein